MKKILTPILLLLIVSFAFAEESTGVTVAKVDYSEIDDLLVEVVLGKPGNEELRDRYNAKERAAKEVHDRMQKKIVAGEAFNPMEAAKSLMHDDEDKKKVQQLCEKHLLELIEQTFNDRYDLIFKDDYRSSLIYSKIAVDDVTVIVKQELLKALPGPALSALEIKDGEADWVWGQADAAFDIKSLKVERIKEDRILLTLDLHGDVPEFREKKTHYRFDFDLDLNDETGHASNKYGGDSLIYVSLQPVVAEEKEWMTYTRFHSDIGEKSNLKVEDLKIDQDTISLEVVSGFFGGHDQFGLYVMTFGDDVFYDEIPNKSEALIDLSK